MDRLYLSDTDKKLAGICGGLGEMLNFDSTIIRLIFVFVGIATGVFPMIIAYAIGWFIIPQKTVGEIDQKKPEE